MTALWVIVAIAVAGYALNWLTAAPAARGVSAAARLAQARRIVDLDAEAARLCEAASRAAGSAASSTR